MVVQLTMFVTDKKELIPISGSLTHPLLHSAESINGSHLPPLRLELIELWFQSQGDMKQLREEIEQLRELRDEMRKCSRATRIEFPRFRGDDVKGWLFKSEHYFQVNDILDESKVIYKDAILQRFGNVKTAKFSCNSVVNSNFSLNLDDDLDEFVVFYQGSKQIIFE
ncbi:hypothetical protein Tco_0527788 [Tanacetum coccineum]